MEELAECTFHPRTTPVPEYLQSSTQGYMAAYMQQRHGGMTDEPNTDVASQYTYRDAYPARSFISPGGVGQYKYPQAPSMYAASSDR